MLWRASVLSGSVTLERSVSLVVGAASENFIGGIFLMTRTNAWCRRFLTFNLMILASTSQLAAQESCDGLIFSTDFDRKVSHGSKDALITAVNSGRPIRVGWEMDFDDDDVGDLSHWADAAYLSIFNGDVFTQVDAVHAQTPDRQEGAVRLRTPYAEWRGSLGSNGVLEGSYSDDRPFPDDIRVKVTWCLAISPAPNWVLLYRNDSEGNPIGGSREALFAAVRSGLPISIAWGFSTERQGQRVSVEHSIIPVYISIINEEHVAAQLPEHIAQQQYADIAGALFDDPAVMWRGLMTTQGTFDAVWVNRATGEQIRRYPQRAEMSWFAPSSPRLDTPSLAIEGGVRRDEGRSSERVPQ